MKDNKNLISHQKSKSISNNITLKDFVYKNNIIKNNVKYNNYYNNNYIIEENKTKENTITSNLEYTIDDMKQHILDLYYDNNSIFKNKIDNLNLQFYLETEKYLNYNKNNENNDIIRSQKLQANLFMILFKQINILIEEIERLNKIIRDSKYKKETIVKRTNELNEKKHNILIKDNLIQSLKQTNNNTEKKLLETLLHEDKLIKDNERLRKENETYKSLTIVFENELKKNKNSGSSSPLDKNYIKHIKTYSDYGFQSNSIINDMYGSSIAKCETINYEKKSPLSDKKIKSINSNRSKELYRTNKYRIINNNKKMKKIVKNIKGAKNNNIKINNSNRLLRNNTLRETIKISLNKASLNFKQKNKKIQDNKNEEMVTNKNRIKKDFSSSNKFAQNNNNTNTHNNKYRILMTHNIGNHNSCNNKKIIKKNKTIKTKKNNLKLNLNNINSAVNVNMTELNNNSSFDKEKTKNFMKFGTQTAYGPIQKRIMSEVSYTEGGKVEIINDEYNNSNHIQIQNITKTKIANCQYNKSLSNQIEENKNNKIGKNIIIQDCNYNICNKNIYNTKLTDDKKHQKK